ncbi:MAG: hypothetical protein ABL962_10195, partial [Fimbriimonadaceae bacterium]
MLTALLLSTLAPPQSFPIFEAPAGRQYAQVVPDGVTILPNGRLLTPLGRRLYTGEDLWQVAMSPDGKTLVGFSEELLTVYSNVYGIPSKKTFPRKELAPAGIFDSSGTKLIVSLGDEGAIEIIDTQTWETTSKISINDATHKEGYVNDLVLSKNNRYAYCADVAHQVLITVD